MQENTQLLSKKPKQERIRITENPNIDELTSTYFLMLRYSIIISATFLQTFYIPQLLESFYAVDYKLEIDPKWNGSYSDAFWYGNWYQSRMQKEYPSSSYFDIFFVSMVIFHLQVFYFAYKSETYYSWLFRDISTFKDLSLEFKNIPKKYDTKEKILALFNEFSNNGVTDLSLTYDMSNLLVSENSLKEYEKKVSDIMENIKRKNNTKNMNALIEAKQKLYKFRDEHINTQTEHNLNSMKYFNGRGFVTFKNQDCAYFVKQVYNKSVRDYVYSNPFDRFFRKISGFLRKKEEQHAKPIEILEEKKVSALDKFKNTSKNIMKKETKDLDKKQNKGLQERIKEIGEAALMDTRSQKLKAICLDGLDKSKPINPKEILQIKRGIKSCDVNFAFEQKKTIGNAQITLIVVIIVLVIPAINYWPSKIAGVQGTKLILEPDNTFWPNILSNGLPLLCGIVDSVATYLIDIVFDKKRFYKNNQRHGLKFITQNAYILSSNLFYQIYGFVVGTDIAIYKKSPEQMRLEMAKCVIGATTMSIVSAVLATMIQLLIPIVKFYLFKKSKPAQHDLTLGLSNANVLLFNLGFYASINPNAIFVVIVCQGFFYFLESWMFTKGIIVAEKHAPEILISLYWINLFAFMLPITLSSLLMLKGNNMGISSIRIGEKFLLERFMQIIGISLWSCVLVQFVYLYKNEKFLGRLQSRIWRLHNHRKTTTIVGRPYKVSNPWYKMQELLQEKNNNRISDKQKEFPKIFDETSEDVLTDAIMETINQSLNKSLLISSALSLEETKKESTIDESRDNLRKRD